MTTDACSEGIDVPECNLVVSMDKIKTSRSLIHTRGRARSKGGKFVIMVEVYECCCCGGACCVCRFSVAVDVDVAVGLWADDFLSMLVPTRVETLPQNQDYEHKRTQLFFLPKRSDNK